MASGQARRVNEQYKRPVVIVGRNGRPRWHDIWENNPRILRSPRAGYVALTNGGGVRPYIAEKTPYHWVWKRWENDVGEIYLNEDEEEFASKHSGFIVVEPSTKDPTSNKAWLWFRWEELVKRFGSHNFVQIGPESIKLLPEVKHVVTTFRQACAVLKYSRAFVGTEGALHHAAAALKTPSVVLWSEFISPDFTGYKSQRNIRHAGKACGARVSCPSCRASMLAIEVDEVVQNLETILTKKLENS